MQASSFLSKLRHRPFWPVLTLAYVLLFQSILGGMAANAHAFSMAQHEALGLDMLCLEGGPAVNPGKTIPQQQAPVGDCIACKIACAAAIGMPVLPLPETAALFIVYPSRAVAFPSAVDAIVVRSARFPSDLASRAPPPALI